MARRTEPVSIWAEAELSYAASCLTGLLVLRVFVVALFSHFAHFSCNKGTSFLLSRERREQRMRE